MLIKDTMQGTYWCRYMPKKFGKYTFCISYGGISLFGSPFTVYVQEASHPSKVKVYGPALEKPVRTFEPTHLFVDCSEAGPGDFYIFDCKSLV